MSTRNQSTGEKAGSALFLIVSFSFLVVCSILAGAGYYFYLYSPHDFTGDYVVIGVKEEGDREWYNPLTEDEIEEGKKPPSAKISHEFEGEEEVTIELTTHTKEEVPEADNQPASTRTGTSMLKKTLKVIEHTGEKFISEDQANTDFKLTYQSKTFGGEGLVYQFVLDGNKLRYALEKKDD